MVGRPVLPLVLHDLEHRVLVKGAQTYNRPFLTNDGRDSLQDAYEEALDLALYLRKVLAERERIWSYTPGAEEERQWVVTVTARASAMVRPVEFSAEGTVDDVVSALRVMLK